VTSKFPQASHVIRMTRLQYQSVNLLAHGYNVAGAAEEIGVSRQVVHKCLRRLAAKYHCKSRAALFYRLGLAAGRNIPIDLHGQRAPAAPPAKE